MAIDFDTTVGGTASTSYVTVVEFNSYVEKMVNAGDMPKASQTTLIKKLLVAATEAVDVEVAGSLGYVTNATQRLEYPRIGITDRRGYAIDENTLPQELKDAVCEQAIYLNEAKLNHAQHDNWEDEVTSGSISGSVKFDYDTGTKPTSLIPSRVKYLLKYMGTAYMPKVKRVRRA